MKSGALLRNGLSPARKRKLNEEMLRSSKAEMPMPPLGAAFSQRLKANAANCCICLCFLIVQKIIDARHYPDIFYIRCIAVAVGNRKLSLRCLFDFS